MSSVSKTALCIALFISSSSSLHLQGEEPWDPISSRAPSVHERKLGSSTPAIWMICFHQQVLSSIDGPRSHFYPTSSDYMRRAIIRHGISGVFLGMDRLLRENSDPWVYPLVRIGTSVRKYDPVP